ncbi:substrate-binding domain-containing protein [Halobacterium zhouii]|uniref:substrate-binding domain-containing protein n=1 Tax=Halobacterium zhouii TaxID=2902624 RepID=UPI001E2D4550|nr:substrate-binding domain-containing protein [Halobacterium zhouii]
MDRRKFLKVAGATGVAGMSAGCIGQFGSQPYVDGTMQFLMSPTEPQDQMRAQYSPVKKRLNSYVDSVDKVTIDYAADYSATLNAMNSGTADVAETGPFAAALGVKTNKADIILQRKAYGGWTYKSVIVTKEDSDIQKTSDLKGKTVAFADPLSASGSLYPLYMMKKAGISIPNSPGSEAGANFTPQWSTHASAIEALNTGQADAAGVGYFIASGDQPDGYAKGLREVEATDGIPRAPIIVSPKLSDEEKDNIATAFTEAPQSMYYGADGKEDTDKKSDNPDDDLWFSGVRKRGVETYQPVIDVANELGYGQDVFKSGTSSE